MRQMLRHSLSTSCRGRGHVVGFRAAGRGGTRCSTHIACMPASRTPWCRFPLPVNPKRLSHPPACTDRDLAGHRRRRGARVPALGLQRGRGEAAAGLDRVLRQRRQLVQGAQPAGGSRAARRALVQFLVETSPRRLLTDGISRAFPAWCCMHARRLPAARPARPLLCPLAKGGHGGDQQGGVGTVARPAGAAAAVRRGSGGVRCAVCGEVDARQVASNALKCRGCRTSDPAQEF